MTSGELSKIASLYGGWRAVGGRLSTAAGRLVFAPHGFDRATGGRALDIPLDSIERISLTRRSLVAPRRNVLIETSDGQRARFLVNGARTLVSDLEHAARTAGASPEIIGL